MRVHSFDSGFPEATEGGDQTERTNVPDGGHTVTIYEAKEGPHRWPDKNPGEFLNLTLQPQSKSHRFIWCSYGDDKRDLAMVAQLAAALGFTAKEWAQVQPKDLVGRIVRVETVEKINHNTGKGKVWVNKFLVPQSEEARAKPRTQAAKVAAARGDEAGEADDIPFVWAVPFLIAAATLGGLA